MGTVVSVWVCGCDGMGWKDVRNGRWAGVATHCYALLGFAILVSCGYACQMVG